MKRTTVKQCPRCSKAVPVLLKKSGKEGRFYMYKCIVCGYSLGKWHRKKNGARLDWYDHHNSGNITAKNPVLTGIAAISRKPEWKGRRYNWY